MVGLAALLALPAASQTISATSQPPTAPVLRIEAGMHTAGINRIATDSQGRYAVTASDDKTARVWDIATGRLLNTLRVPIDAGDEGKLYAVALSPNSQTVAVAGWTGLDWSKRAQIYLFDRSSGRLAQRLGGMPNVIGHLAFSPDGQWLAAGLGGKNGVRVFNLSTGAAALADSDYGGASYGAHFGPSNQLATTSWDGQIRLYSLAGGRLAKLAQVPAPGGKEPHGIAFSATGLLAVGYLDSTRVDVLDGQTLAVRHTPSSAGVSKGALISVAWSADGRSLYAGGQWQQNGQHPLRRWGEQGRGKPVDIATTNDTIFSIQSLPTGGVLVGSGEPSWGVVDAADRWQAKSQGVIADLRGSRGEFGYALSADGKTVQFGYEYGVKLPHRFAMASRSLLPGKESQLLLPRTQGLDIKDWQSTTRPTLNGTPLALLQYETSRSLAIAPNARSFALGTDYWLRHFDATGKQLWEKDVPDVAWGVNISADGRLLVAAYGDGTIRWHRLTDGQELLAFFPHADRKRWVLWTPSGYFDASPGSEELIGWHLNRGQDQAADFFPASRFRSQFYRPDLIDRVLDTLDEKLALTQADQAANRRNQVVAVAQLLPPVVEVLSGTDVSATQPELKIRLRARSAADAPVTGLRVRVDGQLQPDGRGLGRDEKAADEREVTVRLPQQDAEVQVFAENRHGISSPATVRVKWAGVRPGTALATAAAGTASPAAAAGFRIQPTLYVLAVGVGQYQHAGIDKLRLAAKDARDFAAAMQRQQGRLYKKVEVKLLTEADASRDTIVDGLDWLQRQMTQHDMAMVFVSGHGVNDSVMGYTYLPVNADPDKLRRTAVAMDEFKKTLAALPGKGVIFLDTCHSGNVLGTSKAKGASDISGVINELSSAENGVVVFSSSTGRQLSYEDLAWGNGAFTKALIEGINGEADLQKTGRITHKMLDLYVSQRVKQLTNGKQSPVTQAPGGVPDFPLAVR